MSKHHEKWTTKDNLKVCHDLDVKGNLKVGGDATIKKNLFVKEDVIVDRDVIVKGNLITTQNCPVIPLTLSDTIPTVISTPGKYRVINSPNMQITGATTANPNSCIIITSSDVHLDLCDQVLTGSGNKTGPLSPAPVVPGGIQNDIRVDASIGIRVLGSATNVLDNISITNGKLQYYSVHAISASFATNIKLTHLLIENSSTVIPDATDQPSSVLLLNCSGIVVTDNRYMSNRLTDLKIMNTTMAGQNVIVTDTYSTGLRGGVLNPVFFNPAWLAIPAFVQFGMSILGGVFVAGASAAPLQDIVIENVNVADVQAGGFLFGIYASTVDNGITIRNCHITHMVQVFTDTTIYTGAPVGAIQALELRGIAVEQGSAAGLIENCNVEDLTMNILTSTINGNHCTGFNFEHTGGKTVRNCTAKNISSAGQVTVTKPTSSAKLVSDNSAIGFETSAQIVFSAPSSVQRLENQFISCIASNIDGGANPANPAGPTTGLGFKSAIFPSGTSAETLQSTAGVFSNCIAQDVIGSPQSGGFVIFYNLLDMGSLDPENLRPVSPVVFENCITQQDRIRLPNGISNGFLTSVRANNVTFRGCTATGHTLNGFDLSSYTLDTATGNSKFILDNCIANGNSGYGFRLDHSLKQVEVINCKATNNGLDGINAAGRNLIFRNTISDLNLGQGFSFSQYYPFFAKVATDPSNVGMANLGVYGGAYTVTYVPGVATDPAVNQYLNIIPNNSSAPLPASLTINGITVNNGDIVLIKDLIGSDPNTGGERNGVYQASNNGGVVVSGVTVPIWQLIRVDPWRAPYTVPAGTKVLVADSNAPNLTPGPVMYTLTNTVIVDTTVPVFTATLSVAPDPSTIIVDGCKAGQNSSNGLHNSAKSVAVRKTITDLNGGVGILDDSVGGAQANANLYSRNKAFNNAGGNYSFNYSGNPGVLLTGTITSGFPIGIVAPEANISITP